MREDRFWAAAKAVLLAKVHPWSFLEPGSTLQDAGVNPKVLPMEWKLFGCFPAAKCGPLHLALCNRSHNRTAPSNSSLEADIKPLWAADQYQQFNTMYVLIVPLTRSRNKQTSVLFFQLTCSSEKTSFPFPFKFLISYISEWQNYSLYQSLFAFFYLDTLCKHGVVICIWQEYCFISSHFKWWYTLKAFINVQCVLCTLWAAELLLDGCSALHLVCELSSVCNHPECPCWNVFDVKCELRVCLALPVSLSGLGLYTDKMERKWLWTEEQ